MKNRTKSEILDLARESSQFTVVEITHSQTDYPAGLGDRAIIGFGTFEDAEKFASENGCELHLFQTRDGWHFWHDRGRAFEPLSADNYLSNLGDNYYEADEDQQIDLIKDTDLGGQELIDFLKERIIILEELQKASEDQAVLCNSGSYYETVANKMMGYHEDVYTYAIGVFLQKDDE